jgi:hypothetical protein
MAIESIGPRGFGILIFILVMVIISGVRPSFFINEETRDWKTFGFGPGKSCVNITVVSVIVAMGSYLIAQIVATGISKVQRGGGRPLSVSPISDLSETNFSEWWERPI